LDKAEELLAKSPNQADIVDAVAALHAARDEAKLIEAQEQESKRSPQKPRSQRDSPDDPAPEAVDELPKEVASDPDLVGSPEARRGEVEKDPAAAREEIEADRTTDPYATKPGTIDAGTARRGESGQVFDISSMPADAPRDRPAPTAGQPPRAQTGGFRTLNRHDLSQYSRAATAVTRRVGSSRGNRGGSSRGSERPSGRGASDQAIDRV
jgi:hypothetical protein